MNAIKLTCPACDSINRLPAARLSDHPHCGRCKGLLFTGAPLTLTANNVAQVVQSTDIALLVDCWAPWCGPCHAFAPVFAQAARELEPRVRFAKLDTEAEQRQAAAWAIRSIPTLLLFREGREAARISGALSLAQLKGWLAENGV